MADFVVSKSKRFAPGATSARLTPPSGKTTSDFMAGRIEEDVNPAAPVNIGPDDYTEMEWCVQATANAPLTTYDFRIEGLDNYTVIPKLTLT